jgi:carboxylesterase
MLHNAHLEGGPFVLDGNRLGILLIHGFSATTAEVRLLADRLHAENYTVSAPLLPGHYTTPEDLNATKWIDWLDTVDFAYQMLAQKCPIVFVGGESTGAVLSLWLASKYPDIAGIMAYAPAIKLQLSAIDQLKLKIASWFHDEIPKDLFNVNERWQGYTVNPLKAVIQLLKLQRATLKQMPQIHQPIMVVQGRLDSTIHPQSGEIILSKVASPAESKQLYWMEESAHCVLLDNQLDTISGLTLQFIKDTIERSSPKR